MTLHDIPWHAHLEELTQVVAIVDLVSEQRAQQRVVMIGLQMGRDLQINHPMLKMV